MWIVLHQGNLRYSLKNGKTWPRELHWWNRRTTVKKNNSILIHWGELYHMNEKVYCSYRWTVVIYLSATLDNVSFNSILFLTFWEVINGHKSSVFTYFYFRKSKIFEKYIFYQSDFEIEFIIMSRLQLLLRVDVS